METSLEWICAENSLRWVLRAPVGTQIILLDGNILKTVPLDPNRQMHFTMSKRNLQKYSKKSETESYDPEYKGMRKEWRASE